MVSVPICRSGLSGYPRLNLPVSTGQSEFCLLSHLHPNHGARIPNFYRSGGCNRFENLGKFFLSSACAKLILMKKTALVFFAYLLSLIAYLFLGSQSPIQAACFPVDPQTGQCSTGLAACSNDTTCCTDPIECSTRTASCSTDKPGERIPSCDVCGDILFCSGNNYRACTTDEPPFPAPAPGTRNGSGVINNPPSSVRFNNVSYPVPSNGLYFCDSNVYGCGNSLCRSGSAPSPSSTPIPAKDPRNEFPKLNYPCNQTRNPEFHPTRPYPGNPCDPLIPKSWPEKDYISFACGKSLTPKDKVKLPGYLNLGAITETLPDKPSTNDVNKYFRCKDDPSKICTVRKQDYKVNLNLNQASLPILGNSELQGLTDAQKVNQYLLWYLAGTSQATEQKPLDTRNPEDAKRLVDFSGPIKKLLPFYVNHAIKRDEIILGKDSLQKDVIENQIHNYIVGCQKDVDFSYVWTAVKDWFNTVISAIRAGPGTVINLLKLAGKVASFIVSAPTTAANLKTTLESINVSTFGEIKTIMEDSGFNDIAEAVAELGAYGRDYLKNLAQLINDLSLGVQEKCTTSRDEKRLLDFKGTNPAGYLAGYPNRYPPDPKNYDDFDKYWNDYLNWTGRAEFLFFSFDSPFLPNIWAELFKNVPLSTLEDSVGEVTVSVIDDPKHQPEGIITQNPDLKMTLKIDGGTDARLFFPHVRALDALSSILQNLYAPKSATQKPNYSGEITEHQEAGDGPAGDPSKTIEVVSGDNNSSVKPGADAPFALFESHDSLCDLKDVRWNPGDTLYGDTINANLSYYQIFEYSPQDTGGSCLPDSASCSPAGSNCCSGSCNEQGAGTSFAGYYCAQTQPVELTTKGRVAVFTKTPLIDKIYEKLVTGEGSLLKRFLFRLAPYSIEIRDIPAVTSAGYSSNAQETIAGDESGGGEIYFPRVGTIFDTILGGASSNYNLQKLLRPKGFGESTGGNGQCSSLEYDIDYRNPNAPIKSAQEIADALKSVNPGGFGSSTIQKASENIKARYDQLVQASKSAGFNPAFVMATWIEESAASALTAYDFGCGAAAKDDFEGQLSCFLGLYDYWSTGSKDNSLFTCRAGGDHPNFEDFMLFFAEGICDTVQKQNRQFCANHANFPTRFKSFYEIVAK